MSIPPEVTLVWSLTWRLWGFVYTAWLLWRAVRWITDRSLRP